MAQTNALLKSIGAGINLNLSDVVEKQVRSMLARFKAEIQNASAQGAQSGRQMADGLRSAATQIESLLTATQRLGRDGALTETRKGYDALGRSITEVYKNGQLLHKTVSENAALSKDIQYANQLYQEQADALKKIYALKTQRLKTQDGTPAAMDLDSQIADTGRLIDANNQLIALLDQQAGFPLQADQAVRGGSGAGREVRIRPGRPAGKTQRGRGSGGKAGGLRRERASKGPAGV